MRCLTVKHVYRIDRRGLPLIKFHHLDQQAKEDESEREKKTITSDDGESCGKSASDI